MQREEEGGSTYVGRVKEAAAETSGKLVPSCDESFQVFLQGGQREEVTLRGGEQKTAKDTKGP